MRSALADHSFADRFPLPGGRRGNRTPEPHPQGNGPQRDRPVRERVLDRRGTHGGDRRGRDRHRAAGRAGRMAPVSRQGRPGLHRRGRKGNAQPGRHPRRRGGRRPRDPGCGRAGVPGDRRPDPDRLHRRRLARRKGAGHRDARTGHPRRMRAARGRAPVCLRTGGDAESGAGDRRAECAARARFRSRNAWPAGSARATPAPRR